MRDIEWESCALEPAVDPELSAYLRRELGAVPRLAPYMTPCPWVVRSLAGVSMYPGALVHVEIRLADLIGLVVSQDNSCRFCFAMQRALLRMQGFPESRIRALEEDLFAAELDDKERSALDFARRFSRAHPLASGCDLEPLRRAGWSEPAIREIAFSAAAVVYGNRISTLPAIPPFHIEALPDRWWARLLVPLARRRIQGMQRRGTPVAYPPEALAGPYRELVEAFDGLPAAGALRRLLDEAFASPGLPRRSKALVFAVVARGLGCAASETEAARMLAAEGLSPAELEGILAHLASSRLDATEAALLPLARDTIRYRPAQIQRQARALRDAIGVAAFVEFVGVSALANAVCRLAAVTAATS